MSFYYQPKDSGKLPAKFPFYPLNFGWMTSEGIFKVENTTLTYEIVQTEPDISAVPPTASAGFGSSNGGALGNSNIQVYQAIE